MLEPHEKRQCAAAVAKPKLASLQHCVRVERVQVRVEIFDRQGQGWFTNRVLEGTDAVLDLPAIGVSISLAEIHRDVLTA